MRFRLLGFLFVLLALWGAADARTAAVARQQGDIRLETTGGVGRPAKAADRSGPLRRDATVLEVSYTADDDAEQHVKAVARVTGGVRFFPFAGKRVTRRYAVPPQPKSCAAPPTGPPTRA